MNKYFLDKWDFTHSLKPNLSLHLKELKIKKYIPFGLTLHWGSWLHNKVDKFWKNALKILKYVTWTLFQKEAAHIDLAAPSEIGVKACTPFLKSENLPSFLYVSKQKYLPLLNYVIKSVITLFRHMYYNKHHLHPRHWRKRWWNTYV